MSQHRLLAEQERRALRQGRLVRSKASRLGISAPPPDVDMTVVRERKRTMVNGLVDLHNKRFAANHVELVHGQGAFTGARKLSVELTEGGARLLSADVVIESTGSRSTIPDIPGLHAAQPMTHVDALELDVVPEHLLVLGAGYVGLEFDALALESVYPDIRRATVNRFTFFLGRFGERFEDATLVH